MHIVDTNNQRGEKTISSLLDARFKVHIYHFISIALYASNGEETQSKMHAVYWENKNPKKMILYSEISLLPAALKQINGCQ